MVVRFSSWSLGVCYVWVCFCFGFARRWHCGPAFVLRLGVGSPGFAGWGGVVARSGLLVRAVRLVCAGFRFRAVGVGLGLAGLGAFRLCRFARVRGLRSAGSGVLGQSGATGRVVCRRSSRGFAAGTFAFFPGGPGCLGCLAWWRWPVLGLCPRPAPPWRSVWHRISPPGALRLSWAAAVAPMRRCCPPFPVSCRRRSFAAWPRSVRVAWVPVRLRRWLRFPPLPAQAVPSSGGRAVRLRFRCALVWQIARARLFPRQLPGWWFSSLRLARAVRSWLAAARLRAGCLCWPLLSAFPGQNCRLWALVHGCRLAHSAALNGRKISMKYLVKYLNLLYIRLKYEYIHIMRSACEA